MAAITPIGAETIQENTTRYAVPTTAGRADSSSPATGSYQRHRAEQAYLVRRAFGDLG